MDDGWCQSVSIMRTQTLYRKNIIFLGERIFLDVQESFKLV